MSSDKNQKKRPTIFDILNFIVALVAISIPFILRECDKPKISFTANFDYNVNSDSYDDFMPSFASLISSFRHIDDLKNFAINKDIKRQLNWLARLKQFTLKIKNERNNPISLDNLKITNLDYTSPIQGFETVVLSCFIIDEKNNIIPDAIIKLDPGESKILKTLVLFFAIIDSPAVLKIHEESKRMLNVVADSIVKINKNWEFGGDILQIKNGRRYEYLIDWIKKKDSAPFIYSGIYIKYFSKIKFNNLNFRLTDNLNRYHYSNDVSNVK